MVSGSTYGVAMTTTTVAPPLAGLRRIGWWGALTLLVAFGMLVALFSMGLAFERAGSAVRPWFIWLIAGCLGVLAQPALLFWARSHPVRVGYLTAISSLLWPLGWFVPVTAWVMAILWAPRASEGEDDAGDVLMIGILSMIGTWWIIWRDGRQATSDGSLTKLVAHSGQGVDPAGVDALSSAGLPWWFALLMTALLFTAVGSVGAWIRARREEQRTRNRTAALEGQRDDTRSALGRQVERERIAREVHDTLGHRLSLLSVHAGALELQAQGSDEKLATSAAVVGESARRSMDELRSLVGLLREEPDGASGPALGDLRQVVEEALEAGDLVASTITLADVDRVDPALSRAVFRIVQELLTNARKHAPGQTVRLSVDGSQRAGIVIESANAMLGHVPGEGGHGLSGVRERVELLGGTFTCGADGNLFRTRAVLPWRGDLP